MRYKWAFKRIITLLFILIILFIFCLSFYQNTENDEEIGYLDDFDEEKDKEFVKKYMESLSKNQAPIRKITEKEADIDEMYWCFLSRPKNIEKSRKWTKMAGIEVYSAYYDDRYNSLYPNNNAIQILVMSNHSIEGIVNIFCNIYTSNTYSTTRGYIREIWQKGWDPRNIFQIPSLITCPIPKRMEGDEGMYVSLTRKRCMYQKTAVEVENVMKAKKEEGKEKEMEKKDVAVCLKGLDYQNDISERLLEWIEFQYYFGADTIGLYYYYLTPETMKVIKYHESIGKLTVTQLTLSGNDPNDPIERSEFLKTNRPAKRRHELIPYNDCFYRHIHTHKYVLIIDIDEVIIPIQHNNYGDLIREMEHKSSHKYPISSLSARNVFKFQSNYSIYPQYEYMLNNRKRSKKMNPNGEYGKSFSSTSTVATVFNHFALHKLFPNVSKTWYFEKEQAIKLHYKSECPYESKNECHQLKYEIIDDMSLDKYDKDIRKRVKDIANIIGI